MNIHMARAAGRFSALRVVKYVIIYFATSIPQVFVGMVRPIIDTFATEKRIDEFTMEYRTRHSIDGCIMDCEQRIALATGYMVHEVKGVNAMNFMHRDDVGYVIIALRQSK